MMRMVLLTMLVVFAVGSSSASVWINEIFINPPGGFDDTKEFIELAGTPGKKLDGYMIVNANGTADKFYPLGSIPPFPSPAPEFDEAWSLDGLELGANGLLVIAVAPEFFYPTVVADTNFQRWDVLWNGFLDTPGKLENDGSATFMLVRNRPGATEATNPVGPPAPNLRWGKDVRIDAELITPVVDPQDGMQKDQYGDGTLDKGEPNNYGGNTLDIKGASTPGDITDDLEIVDEVSWENGRGWEYDEDGRDVDLGGSTINGLPERRVHALDDPQDMNPDALTRVDYRTNGDGWLPAPGAAGALPNGNNWQDTATEQWIRGEAVGAEPFYYDVAVNPASIQGFFTDVPLWLSDGMGVEFSFTPNSYAIEAGRVNQFATPYIPGDTDRDGDADMDDIAKLAAVFGDDDWIFSNSFSMAPEGDSGDPATQTRPWDVDLTGDNGVEASDLQWVLNFFGDTTGRIVGVEYDGAGPTPPGAGVVLNSSAGVEVTVDALSTDLSSLTVGDTFQVTVTGAVTSGANLSAGEENGIMQYVHDVAIDGAGVVKVLSVTAAGSFAKTRAGLELLEGASGDLGVSLVNGYTTDFTVGLAAQSALYVVEFEAIGAGDVTISVSPAADAKFAASTPQGVKVGHTDNFGNPSGSVYVASVAVSVAPGGNPADFTGDGCVDSSDLNVLLTEWNCTSNCTADLTGDDAVDSSDLNILLSAWGDGC